MFFLLLSIRGIPLDPCKSQSHVHFRRHVHVNGSTSSWQIVLPHLSTLGCLDVSIAAFASLYLKVLCRILCHMLVGGCMSFHPGNRHAGNLVLFRTS